MTDEQFAAWLAGFFDGEGCIYLPKGPGVEISIGNTNKKVIYMIFKRLGVGIVSRTRYTRPEWKDKYSWRVRNYPQVERILVLMRPFLAIKGRKADEALARIKDRMSVRMEKHRRNHMVMDLVESGMRRVDVAKRAKITRGMVDWIVRNGRSLDPLRWDKKAKSISVSLSKCQKIKQSVSSSSKRTAWSPHREPKPRRTR